MEANMAYKRFIFESPYDMDEAIFKELSKIATRFNKKYSTLVSWTKTDKEVMRTSSIGLVYPVTVCVYDITVKLPVIRWKGYEYIATLKKECGDEKDNQVFAVSAEKDESFDAYFQKEFRCDHCTTKRFRKIVHLFRNKKGKELMIASSCAKEYFGIDIASSLNKLFNFFAAGDIEIGFSTVFDLFWKKSNPFNKEMFCRLCYGLITRDGHYIKGGGTTAEANSFMDLSFNDVNDSAKYELDKVLKFSEKFDYNKMVEYWKAKPNPDTFTHNVCVAFGMYQPQHGYLAWAVYDYMKNVEGFVKPINTPNSNHVGTIGERITTEAKIINIRGMETAWGFTRLVEMIDNSGNILNWWTSKDCGAGKEDNVKVTGTVKDHGEFRGVKNTLLKNCKMEVVNVGA